MYGVTALYEPDWWAKLTGMDWGTSRCLRNSVEAYVCFSEMMFRAESDFGWNSAVVDKMVSEAFKYKGNPNLENSAYTFWKAVQENFLKWVRLAGWNIVDLPKWDDVLRQIDLSTESAFDYMKIKEEADRIIQNTAMSTTSDLWYLWQTKVPMPVRVGTYVVVGGAVLAYTAPVLRLLGKLIYVNKGSKE